MHKTYDLAVKSGSYTQNGETKNRYENIGSVMEGDKGPFIMLKRHINLAAFPFKEGGDAVLVSMFEPKDRDSNFSNGSQRREEPRRRSAADLDDDVPF